MKLIIGIVLSALVGSMVCDDNIDISSAFMEVADTFFSDTLPRHEKFQDTSTDDKSFSGVLGQAISGLGNLLVSESINQQGKNDGQSSIDLTMFAPFMQLLASSSMAASNHMKKMPSDQKSNTPAIDFESFMSMANMFIGFKTDKIESIMDLLPILLQRMNSGGLFKEKLEDHAYSSGSWYLPPVIENLYIVWEHLRNSEFGRTLWENSGLAYIVNSMKEPDGHIKYELILESFENPSARRRWIKSLTTFVANWISHISDPAIQQRYLTTAQFVGNSFLNSQGFPQTTFFDASQPAESLTRIINAAATKYLDVNLDSSKYIKPAISYIQDLIKLASKQGFIMSRVNANELSSRLSNTINNDIVSPLLKTYRAYKWAVKEPHCSTHILCVINERAAHDNSLSLQNGLIKISSFSAALAISHNTGISLRTLYNAIQANSNCYIKYPADCSGFHMEEVRVTTEATHSEL